MTPLEKSRETLAHLNNKLAESDRRSIDLETEAQRIALDALTGNEPARKRLDKLNSERATHELESRNVKTAIRAQEAVVAEAARAEAMAAQAANAKEVMKVSERIAARGAKIDAAFQSASAELAALFADADELHMLGVTHPRHDQIRVNGSLALATHLMVLPVKVDREHLAPRERTSFSALCDGWSTTVSRQAAPFVPSEAAAE